MNTFAVSFRIEHDAQWSDRYNSFMDAIRKTKVWDETTSFCLVETSESLRDFQYRLYMSKFSPMKDRMLIIDVRLDNAITSGDIEYPATLRSMLPLVIV